MHRLFIESFFFLSSLYDKKDTISKRKEKKDKYRKFVCFLCLTYDIFSVFLLYVSLFSTIKISSFSSFFPFFKYYIHVLHIYFYFHLNVMCLLLFQSIEYMPSMLRTVLPFVSFPLRRIIDISVVHTCRLQEQIVSAYRKSDLRFSIVLLLLEFHYFCIFV